MTRTNMQKLKDIINKLLKENDNILNVRGGRGYGVGHPYTVKTVKPVLGKSDYEEEFSEDEETITTDKKVKISKAFKRKKDDLG